MSREDNIYYARLAEQGERYEDMIRFMKNVASVSLSQLSIYNLPKKTVTNYDLNLDRTGIVK